MKSTFLKIIIAFGAVTILLVVVWGIQTFEVVNKKEMNLKVLSPEEEDEVILEDKSCKSNSDCMIIELSCSGCGSEIVVNKTSSQKYRDEKAQRCKEYFGPVCLQLLEYFPRCVEGMCRMDKTQPEFICIGSTCLVPK